MITTLKLFLGTVGVAVAVGVFGHVLLSAITQRVLTREIERFVAGQECEIRENQRKSEIEDG